MLVGYNWSDAFTMGIEVALRNGNLAIALAATLFPASQMDDPIGRAVFFTTLFYAGASLVLSMISVAWRRFQLARLLQKAERPKRYPPVPFIPRFIPPNVGKSSPGRKHNVYPQQLEQLSEASKREVPRILSSGNSPKGSNQCVVRHDRSIPRQIAE
jgi:hypothetical protein